MIPKDSGFILHSKRGCPGKEIAIREPWISDSK